jgi:FkbM family methyltransferase
MRIRIPDRLKYFWQLRKDNWRQRRWASVAGSSRTLVTKLQPNLRIRIYGDSQLCRLIYCRNFEMTERAFVNHFLRPGDVFVDVGANIGLFTLIAASRVGPTGRVIAFEPTSQTYDRLVRNVELNRLSNVDCVKSALSDHSGQLDLVRSVDGYDAWNSFAGPTKGHSVSSEQVDVIEWDRYAAAHGLSGNVTMMKIDVEGWEGRVLAGGRETLSRPDSPILQVEFTDDAAQAAGSSCRDLYALLESLGYRMFLYDAERRTLAQEPLRDHYPYANLLAVKNSDLVHERVRGGQGLAGAQVRTG